MHNDVTHLERQYGSCSHAQIQMGASSASSGGNSKSMGCRARSKAQTNRLSCIRTHVSITAIQISTLGKYDGCYIGFIYD